MVYNDHVQNSMREQVRVKREGEIWEFGDLRPDECDKRTIESRGIA